MCFIVLNVKFEKNDLFMTKIKCYNEIFYFIFKRFCLPLFSIFCLKTKFLDNY